MSKTTFVPRLHKPENIHIGIARTIDNKTVVRVHDAMRVAGYAPGYSATAWLKRKGIQDAEIFTRKDINVGSANVGDGAFICGAPWVQPEVLYPLIRNASHPVLRSVSKQACVLISNAVKAREELLISNKAEAPVLAAPGAEQPTVDVPETSIVEDLLHALRAQNAVIARLLKAQGVNLNG